MTSAGVGVAVQPDGFTAAGLAAHRALVAAGVTSADVAMVFAGIRHDEDEYGGVLSAVQKTIPPYSSSSCRMPANTIATSADVTPPTARWWRRGLRP